MGSNRGIAKTRGSRGIALPLVAGAIGVWGGNRVPTAMADQSYNGPDGGSWFVAGNWANPASIPASTATLNIGDGAGLLAGDNSLGEGVVFNPSSQTPGTLSYSYVDLYIVHGQSSNTFENSSIASLDSGTLTATTSLTVGRFGNDSSTPLTSTIQPTGELIINGADVVADANLDIADPGTVSANDVAANGSLIFDTGTLSVTTSLRVGETTAASATFTNNGQGMGVITVGNFDPGALAGSNSTLNINDGGGSANNGVTLISAGTTKIGDVSGNVDQSSAAFNFNLVGAPVMTLNPDATSTDYLPANIDLINSTSDSGYFSSVQGTAETFSSTPVVTATFGGNTYTWTLYYTGSVSGSTISATGGKDVVLIGTDSTIAIPEPASLALVGIGGLALMRRRRRRT